MAILLDGEQRRQLHMVDRWQLLGRCIKEGISRLQWHRTTMLAWLMVPTSLGTLTIRSPTMPGVVPHRSTAAPHLDLALATTILRPMPIRPCQLERVGSTMYPLHSPIMLSSAAAATTDTRRRWDGGQHIPSRHPRSSTRRVVARQVLAGQVIACIRAMRPVRI